MILVPLLIVIYGAFVTYRSSQAADPLTPLSNNLAMVGYFDPEAFSGRWRAVIDDPQYRGSGLLEIKISFPHNGSNVSIQLVDQTRFQESPFNRGVGIIENNELVATLSPAFSAVFGKVQDPIQITANIIEADMIRVSLTSGSKHLVKIFRPANDPIFASYDAPRLNKEGANVTTYTYRKPASSANISAAAADKSGVSSIYLEALVGAFLSEPNFYTPTSLLIMKDGQLILEEYFHGASADDVQQTMSVSKSVVSLLYGIASFEGYLPPPDTKLSILLDDFFPELRDSKLRQSVGNLTVEAFLEMSDIFGWNDHFWGGLSPQTLLDNGKDFPPIFAWAFQGDHDWLTFAASNSARSNLSDEQNYNSIYTQLLGEAVRRSIGCRSLKEYATEKLFDPLGFQNVHWSSFWNASTSSPCLEKSDDLIAFGGLHLRPIDMAKLGQLVLQDGSWHGMQLVPKGWLVKSTRVKTLPNRQYTGGDQTFGYGYQWWMHPYQRKGSKDKIWSVAAEGMGGQRVIILPKYNVVVVTTAFHYGRPTDSDRIVTDYLLPAITDGKPTEFKSAPISTSMTGRSPLE